MNYISVENLGSTLVVSVYPNSHQKMRNGGAVIVGSSTSLMNPGLSQAPMMLKFSGSLRNAIVSAKDQRKVI